MDGVKCCVGPCHENVTLSFVFFPGGKRYRYCPRHGAPFVRRDDVTVSYVRNRNEEDDPWS